MSVVFFKMAAVQRNECIIDNLGENTEINTPNNVTSTLLSDFAFELPSSRCQRKLPFGLIFGAKARRQQFSSDFSLLANQVKHSHT